MASYCANNKCRWHKEARGGVFKYRSGQWYCEDCWSDIYIGEPGKDLWSFETLNIAGTAGKPVQVKSLRHLRQLEKEHGVISVAANYDSANYQR